ncbi:hypothetical protein AVEN_143502-1 [Araneus ventricosus]|uniref:Uncharacterized protein n=1 Tax=Araneus ventricosus TaxID=182803 RepID=A0A4Y2KP60_ARAVE|nr:hypothetical protein AVEN_143502-1 [Araneus ventricosus]
METFVTTLYPCRRQGFQTLLDKLSLLSGFDLANLNRGEILGLFVHLLLIKMPPKRQNIGRRTNAAKSKREERQNETEETAQRFVTIYEC